MPGALETIWAAARDDSERHDIAIMAQQLDTLATALGNARGSTIPSPQSIPDNAAASQIATWEAWYNGAPVTNSALMPTTVFAGSAPADAATWSSLVALAASRTVPEAVRAYLSIQGSSWDVARPHWATDTAMGTIFDGFERMARAWWFTRLGGTSGTPAAFTGGTAGGAAAGGGMSDGMKIALAAFAAYLLSRRKKRR